MNNILNKIKTEIYDKCGLIISNFKIEPESQEYNACQFEINGHQVLCRNAKITPKKTGQFVTFWKRNKSGTIEPFHKDDNIDFYVINVHSEGTIGQFIFPKSILVKKGIVSTIKREGKRGFRVYPAWDVVKSKQAERTQKWQLEYFFELNNSTNLSKVLFFYTNPIE